jgi:CRISPR type III-A-associated RAMP protein Csm4
MNPGLVVKLRPSGPWRIGPDSGARNRVDVIYHSDSLYSAITSAMARLGWLEEWLDATARTGAPAVSFSSCFPYLDDIVFVVPPRTLWPPASPSAKAARVRWKSARFVPLTVVQSILAGLRLDENQWSVDGPSDCLVPAGSPGPFRTAVRSNAGVDRLTGASERHSTACIEFRAGSGLWTVVSFEDQSAQERWSGKVKAAFRLLADTGFGGERSRGWGRSEAPEFTDGMLPDLILPVLGESEAAAEPVEGAEAAVKAAMPVAPMIVEPESAKASAESATIVPESATFVPESATIVPESTTIAPESATLAPESTTIAPESATIAPESTTIAPESATLAPESATIVPESATIVPESATIVPESATFVPESATIVPESTTILQSRDREGAVPDSTNSAEGEAPAAEPEAPAVEAAAAPDAPAAEAASAPDAVAVETSPEPEAPAVEAATAPDAPAAEVASAPDAPVAETAPEPETPAVEAAAAPDALVEEAAAVAAPEVPAAETAPAPVAPVIEAAAAPEAPAAEAVAAPEAPAVETAPEPEAPAVEAAAAPDALVAEAVGAPQAPAIETAPEPEASAIEAVAAPEAPAAEAAAVAAPGTAAEEATAAEPEAPAVETAPAPAPESPVAEPAPPAKSEAERQAPEVEVAPAVVAAAPTHPHWLLSLFTPAPADSVDWRRGNYTVLPRGGRVDSPAGSGELKKQIPMVAEGSVLYAETAPRGSAANVAPDGFAHPVFRAGFAVAIPLPEVR